MLTIFPHFCCACAAQALSGIEQFDPADFDQLEADAKAPAINPPWELVYPVENSNENQSDWTKVWINDNQDDGRPLIKVQGFLMGVTSDQAFNHFYDGSTRNRWDHFVGHCQTVERFPSHSADVFLSVFATPPGIKNREFVEYRQISRVKNGGILMLARSCTHPKVPLSEHRERGSTIYSGYVFKNVKTPDGGSGCIVTGLIKQDLGGYIPSFMINQLNKRIIAEWMNLFIMSVLKTYSGQKYKRLMALGVSSDSLLD